MLVNTVAIIGGGPSGIIALDALVREKKFQKVSLFERRREAGGCWIFDEAIPEPLPLIKYLSVRKANNTEILEDELPGYFPKRVRQSFYDTATYSYLESNVEACAMEFVEEPFPEIKSEESIRKYGKDTPFRHNSVIKEYIQNLYKKKGYDDFLQFNTSVELVEKDKLSNKWIITLRRFGAEVDYLWRETFDAVIVASGHYDVPFVPNISGLQKFHDNPKKIVIHTKAYRSREHFRNKRTVVVGGSVSAMDAVQDILTVSELPVISSQKKTTKPHVYFGDEAFKHPSIDRRGEIVNIDNVTSTIFFDDGSSVSGVDAIIFGTGYSFSFPFLPNLDLSENRVQGLYQHIFKMDDPTLSFIGAVTAGLTFKVYEWQAVLVAKVYSNRARLPAYEEQKRWETKRLHERGNGANFITFYPDFEEYFETIRKMAGEEGPGKQLPKFDNRWEMAFYRGHERRKKYWTDINAAYLQP